MCWQINLTVITSILQLTILLFTSVFPPKILNFLCLYRAQLICRLTNLLALLALATRLYLGLPSGPFPSGLPTKTLYASLLSSILAKCPT